MQLNLHQEKVQFLDEAFILFQRLLKENKFTEREIDFLTKVFYFLVRIHEDDNFKKNFIKNIQKKIATTLN